jgi:GntR family transcriptional regulator
MEEKVLMLLRIKPSSGEPIYKQLIEQLKRFILSGKVKEGDFIPSVRQVAQHLEVNPMTISKAYNILEVQGILNRVRGKGMQVAKQQLSSLGLEDRVKQLEPIIKEMALQAKELGVPQEKVLELISNVFRG